MSEATSQHAGEERRTLTVRLPAPLRRRFAAMCMEIGVSQQWLIEDWVRAGLDEYDIVMRGKRAEGVQ